MHLTLIQIAARSVLDDGVVFHGTRRLLEALQRQGHNVDVITLASSLARTYGRMATMATDAIWCLPANTDGARARGPVAFALAEELGLPTLGATSCSLHRTSDEVTIRALLTQARIDNASPNPVPGKTRAFVAWLANDTTPQDCLGAVMTTTNGRIEPLQLVPNVSRQMVSTLHGAATILGLTEWALFEVELDNDGQTAIVSVDPLPSWEDDSVWLASLEARGLSIDTIVSQIVSTARSRLRLTENTLSPPNREQILVGLIFNIKRVKPSYGGANDEEAEFDSPATIEALATAIRSFGHEVVLLEATPELASAMQPGIVDVVFNVAEGIRGRSREAQVPALLELCDIPYTGSDPATLLLAQDKGLAKRVVRQAGIPTPNWFVMHTSRDDIPRDLRYPVVVKPIAEGSSKGVLAKSVAENEHDLREAATAIVERYPDGVIVEEYLPGREFTVGLLGEQPVRMLPPMEIVFRADLHNPIYTFDYKLNFNDEVRYDAPAHTDAALLEQIEKVAKGAFLALGCRDIARIDLRMDAQGIVNFIECNPLPGLAPKWSDLSTIAQSAGMDYNELIGEILGPALRRFKAKQATLQRIRNRTL